MIKGSQIAQLYWIIRLSFEDLAIEGIRKMLRATDK